MTIRENRARTELWRRAKRMSLLSDESRQRILKTLDGLVEFHAVREGVDLPEESGTLPPAISASAALGSNIIPFPGRQTRVDHGGVE